MNDLTAREAQIAALVAMGKNNRAIASELSVSLRTVENHLYSIYSKVGVCNRTQLAVRMYRETALLSEAV